METESNKNTDTNCMFNPLGRDLDNFNIHKSNFRVLEQRLE
jgi:hypothetical protein